VTLHHGEITRIASAVWVILYLSTPRAQHLFTDTHRALTERGGTFPHFPPSISFLFGKQHIYIRRLCIEYRCIVYILLIFSVFVKDLRVETQGRGLGVEASRTRTRTWAGINTNMLRHRARSHVISCILSLSCHR